MTPLQEKSFKLLCEIDDVCKKHNIVYYLIAGTAIGAIRHQGMIPWDDDIDVAMTRDNWNKFEKIMSEKISPDRALVSFEKYPDYRFTYPQYKDTSTCLFFYSGVLVDYPLGIFIDILILDPVKSEEKILNRHFETLKVLGELVSPAYVLNPTTNYWKYNFYLFLSKFIGRKKILDYLQNKLLQTTEDDCDGYAQRVAYYSVYIEKKFVEKPDYARMYGREFPIMSRVYEYLRYTYGDSWMHFPPDAPEVSSGTLYHGFLCDPNYPYQVFLKDYQTYIDKDKYKKATAAWKRWHFLSVQFGTETVLKANLMRWALVYKLKINNQIKNIDIIDWYNKGKIAELHELFANYLEWQFSSDFTKNKISIPVSEEAIYVLGMLLVLNSEYYKANTLLKMNEVHKKKKWYQDVTDAIEASRALSIAFYDERENWKHIKELVDEYLPKYPHHVDFIVAKCKLLLRNVSFKGTNKSKKKTKEINKNKAAVPNEVLRICSEELKYHDNNGYLFDVMADAFARLKNVKQAAVYYKKAYRMTDDGMLRQQISTKLTQLGIDVDVNSIEDSNDGNILSHSQIHYQEQVKQYQAGLVELLKDFDEICTKENIPYFLGGLLAAEAKELGTFAPECCSEYIIMHPADRKRLIEAVKKHAKPDRVLESFENNSNYPDFSMRYCDTRTTLFDVRTAEFYKYHALNLTIDFVRREEKSKWKRKICSGLYSAVEANVTPSFYYNMCIKKGIAGIFGVILFFLLGKKNGKRLAWNMIYKPNDKNSRIKGTIKDYWYNPVQLPTVDFSTSQKCSINGVTSRVPINYEEFIKPQIASKWNTGKPVGRLLKSPFVPAMEVNCKDLAEELKKISKISKYSGYFLGKLCLRIANKKAAYVIYAWNICLRSVARIQLKTKYDPLKTRIVTLYKEGKYGELYKILKEYIDVLRVQNARGMSVIFDEEIFRITWAVLDKYGGGDYLEKLLPESPKNI